MALTTTEVVGARALEELIPVARVDVEGCDRVVVVAGGARPLAIMPRSVSSSSRYATMAGSHGSTKPHPMTLAKTGKGSLMPSSEH